VSNEALGESLPVLDTERPDDLLAWVLWRAFATDLCHANSAWGIQ
jgi:hypothetical protein